MYTPSLLPIAEVLTATRLRLPSLPVVHASIHLFVVAQGGWFAGRRFERGDLVACRDTSEPQGPVVLEARGHGRPRLGAQDGRALYGDGGEACSPLRWRVAGEVVAVLRPDAAESGGSDEGVLHPSVPGWRVIGLTVGAVSAVLDGPTAAPLRLVEGPVASPPGGRAHRNPRPERAWCCGQLSLFAESAARAA